MLPVFSGFAVRAATVGDVDAAASIASSRAMGSVEMSRSVLDPTDIEIASLDEDDPAASVLIFLCARDAQLRSTSGAGRVPAWTMLILTTRRRRTIRILERADTLLLAVRRAALPTVPYFPAVLRMNDESAAMTREVLQRLTPIWMDHEDLIQRDLSDRRPGEVREIAVADVVSPGTWERTILEFVSRSLARTLIEEASSERLEYAAGLIRTRSSDRAFTVDAVAAEMHLSRRSVEKLFAAQGGFARSLRRYRADRAVRLIASGTRDWATICRSVGFGSVRTMIRAVYEFYGKTPAELAGERETRVVSKS